MSEPFDPYRKWLGIPEGERPPSHYQLLGISPRECNPEVIHAAGVRQSGYVRRFQTGRFSEEANRILNEIAAAQVCLLNLARRATYDSQRNAVEGAGPTAAPRALTSTTERPGNERAGNERSGKQSATPPMGDPTPIPLAPLAMEDLWNERLPTPNSATRAITQVPSIQRPLPRSRKGNQPWAAYIPDSYAFLRWTAMTRPDRRLAKKAATLLIFGIGSFVLPYFGLEFRRFRILGDALLWFAVASGVIGLMLLLVALRRNLLYGLGTAGGLACVLAVAVVDSPINPWVTHWDRIERKMEREWWSEHRAQGAVRVIVKGLPRDQFVEEFARERLREISAAQSTMFNQSGDTMKLDLAPVSDLRALAAKIDFGDVTSINGWTRTIRVRADPSRLPAPLGPVVIDPFDPQFYPRNIADLTSPDPPRRKPAAERLARNKPNEWQPQVVAALEKLLLDSQVENRKAAIDALAVWGTGKYLDVLLSLLAHDDETMQQWAAQALVRVGDPRAVKPLCDLLEHRPMAVFNYLRQFGAAAEPTLLDYLHNRGDEMQILVIRLLGEVGTQSSIAPLTDLAESGFRALELRHDSRQALEQIRRRIQKPD